jgi:uncharacterized membrane protein YeaQ/YmgE (transglycosylase-associated protein family)
MNSIDLMLIVLVSVIFGSIGQLTSGYSKGGWIVNLALGFLGALAGVVVSRTLKAPVIYDLKINNVTFPLMYSVIGAVFFVAGISFLVKPGRR